MSYICSRQVATRHCQRRKDRLIQPGRIFAGKLGGGWYVPSTFCEDQALAEDLIKQFGTTFK